MKIDEILLLEIRTGIMEAIGSEGGLDGADGTYLLSRINTTLGLDVADYSVSSLYEAAPDLLAACRVFVSACTVWKDRPDDITLKQAQEMAEKAIKKATQ